MQFIQGPRHLDFTLTIKVPSRIEFYDHTKSEYTRHIMGRRREVGEGGRREGRKEELKENQSGDRELKKNGTFPFLVALIYLLLFPVLGHSRARLSVGWQLKRAGNAVS